MFNLVENYNFFLTNMIYNWNLSHGKMSPLSSFTVINANDRFVQHLDSADRFIKDELKKVPLLFREIFRWNMAFN